MKVKEGIDIYEVHFSIPQKENGGKYNQNMSAVVLADCPIEAMKMIRSDYPISNICSCLRRGHQWAKRVILIQDGAIE